MALSKTSFGNSILQAREDRLANPDRVNKQKNDRGDRELSGLNRDNMLERRVAQQAAMGPRGGAATGVQPRPAVRTAPQPVSQIAKPLGPGGPRASSQQMQDILAKTQAQQAVAASTNPYNTQQTQDVLAKTQATQQATQNTAPLAPVSSAEINAFVQANLNNPAAIADAAQKYGVNQQQLMDATGYSNEQIGNFFQSAGMANPFATIGAQTQQPVAGGIVGQPMMGGVSGQPALGSGGLQTNTQPMIGGMGFDFGADNFSGGTAQPAGAFGGTGSQAAFGSASGGGFNGYSGGGLAALFRKK